MHLQRYMAPIYVSWVVLVVAVVYQATWRRPGIAAAKIGTVALAIFYLGWYGNQGVLFLRDGGEGPNRDDYRRANAATVEKLEQLDHSESIYTNEVYLVYYLTGRPSYRIPTRQDLAADELQEGTGGQFSLFRSRMAEGAYLILFDSIRDQGGTFPAQELTEGLVPMEGIAEGAVFVDPNAHPVASP